MSYGKCDHWRVRGQGVIVARIGHHPTKCCTWACSGCVPQGMSKTWLSIRLDVDAFGVYVGVYVVTDIWNPHIALSPPPW